MSVNCEINIPDVPGLIPQQLTVGRHFFLLCKGDWPSGFDFSKASFVEEHKYEFVLVKASSEKLDVVSYLTGELPTKELPLFDGSQTVVLSLSTVKVDSVLPAPSPPEKTEAGTAAKPPEPFGYVVSSLHWPVGYTIFFVVVFCASLALLIQQILKRQRRRRLLLQLEDYNSATSPDSQFYKSLRQLEKQNYPISEIEKQFRLYVIRKYQVPLFGMNLNEAMSYLKKKWPLLRQERRELKNILLDLKKMNEGAQAEDTQKYLKKLYQFVDHSEEVIASAGRKEVP